MQYICQTTCANYSHEVISLSAQTNTCNTALDPACYWPTLGPCHAYGRCGTCGKNRSECPNLIIDGVLCACGHAITQSDLWQGETDSFIVCRYCRPAASYIKDLLVEARSCPQPVTLSDLWQACPWRPELTEVIVTHLQAAGVVLLPPDPQRMPQWARKAFAVHEN